MTEKETRISISNLTTEVEQRRNVISCPVVSDEQREIVDKWMTMFTSGYVKEKIIEARLKGDNYCVLSKEKMGDGFFRRIFNEQIEPYDQSVEHRLESFIDPKEIRVICSYISKNKKGEVEIILYWGYYTMMLPSFLLEYPEIARLVIIFLVAIFVVPLVVYMTSNK